MNPRKIITLSKIQNKLFIAFVLVVIPPLILVEIYSINSTTKALERSALDSAAEEIFLKAKKIEKFLSDKQKDIFFLSQLPPLRNLIEASDSGPGDQIDFWRREVGRQFLVFSQAERIYSRIRYIDEDGQEIVRVDSDGVRSWIVDRNQLQSRSDRFYFAEAMKLLAGRVLMIFSPLDRDAEEASTEPAIRYATSIFDRESRKKGIVIADIFASYFLTITQEGGAEAEGKLFLVKDDGVYLSHPDKANLEDENLSRDYIPGVASQILSGRPGTITDGADAIISYAPIFPKSGDTSRFWVLVDTRPKSSIFAPVRSYTRIFLTVLIAALLVALALSALFARRLTQPLTQLRDGVRSIGRGKLGHRLKVYTNDEIEELADEFNNMADMLEKSYSSLEERIQEKTRELEKANAELIQSEKLAAIGTLASGVAHEINNPLDGLFNCISRIKRRPEDAAQTGKYLNLMTEALSRIASVVRQLLDFSKKHELALEPTDINKVLEDTISLADYGLKRSDVRVEKNFEPSLPPIMGDGNYLQQVFLNLTLNSIAAMPGGGRLKFRSYLSSGDGSSAHVCVEVRDTGVGIPKSEIGKIFDPFYTTKRTGEGTGLGLSISYNIVKEHNGQIEVESVEGEGTTFRIKFPLDKVG